MSADMWMFVGLVAVCLVLLVIGCVANKRSRERAKANGGIDPKIAEAQERSQVIQKQYQAEREQQRLAQTVVKTQVLDSRSSMTSKGSIASSAGRAVVGGMVAGPIGAVVGASTGKRNYREHKNTTFKVWYADGSTNIKTVSNGSYDWKQYMDKLER